MKYKNNENSEKNSNLDINILTNDKDNTLKKNNDKKNNPSNLLGNIDDKNNINNSNSLYKENEKSLDSLNRNNNNNQNIDIEKQVGSQDNDNVKQEKNEKNNVISEKNDFSDLFIMESLGNTNQSNINNNKNNIKYATIGNSSKIYYQNEKKSKKYQSETEPADIAAITTNLDQLFETNSNRSIFTPIVNMENVSISTTNTFSSEDCPSSVFSPKGSIRKNVVVIVVWKIIIHYKISIVAIVY